MMIQEFHVSEMRFGMNEFGHRTTSGALQRHSRGQGSNPRCGLNFQDFLAAS